MKRPLVIAGNWKMHKTIGEATRFIRSLAPLVKDASTKILIAPPYTALAPSAEAASGTQILIGAQNMSDSDEGAFTGEISARMIKDAGASFVILGHSERRSYFGETDEHIHHKLKRAFVEGLSPILCIGESEKEREEGRSKQILEAQLEQCLKGFDEKVCAHLIVAYEPVWAIGTGKAATPEIAQEAHTTIRRFIEKNLGKDFAQQIPILYGGSVKPNNIANLLTQPDIDGALIGGASLDVEAFSKMVLQ